MTSEATTEQRAIADAGTDLEGGTQGNGPKGHEQVRQCYKRMDFGVSLAHSFAVFQRWWNLQVLETVDQPAVIAERREEAYISPRYLFMIAMSAGIAILGLLMSSTAVVIGAMLIAPLMGPIIGAGFALAIGDYRWLAGSVQALLAGTALGIALTALVVFVSPLQTITSEIAARTQPTLFDLGVAVFSGLAGAYAMIRGRGGAIVGVAIATSLMPPLATVGFGLATVNWTVFWGAGLLYLTNLMTIALMATVIARLYGFSKELSEKQTRWQTLVIVVIFLALATPLFFALKQIAWETTAARQIRTVLGSNFATKVRISAIDFDLSSDPITVEATVLTPQTSDTAERSSQERLTQLLGRPVALGLTQFVVGTQSEAEATQLAAAAVSETGVDARKAQELGQRLALLAGVEPQAVTTDRQNRRAVVRASPLEGADLATFRALERRLAAQYSDWSIQLVPPLLPLPAIAFAEGEPTDAGRANLALTGWASQRLGLPLVLEGGNNEARTVAAAILREAGVEPRLLAGGPTMQARWDTPENE